MKPELDEFEGQEVTVKLPPKLVPLFSGEADVRGAHGGRGSAKTRSFAKMTAIRAVVWASEGREGIILCAREFMNSLDDSSMEEVKAAINSEPWLAALFDIGEKYIRTKCGRISYKFAGLSRNLSSVKSKSRILLCWVDEAEPVTEAAWAVLIPTLREDGCELWITWNPENDDAPVHLRFRLSSDPRVKIVEINWRDNPWFPEVLERTRLRDQRDRPAAYENVWEGAFINQSEGAFWTDEMLRKSRKATYPDLRRVIVSIDPSGTKGDDKGDDIGIIVAGKGIDGRGYVLADRTCQLGPEGWARIAITAYHEFQADCIVAERNFGGAMVESVLRSVDKFIAYKEVTASRGKAVRAEPVAALYEQGLISHVGHFTELERQLCRMTPAGYMGNKSPDRADALVWALTELMGGSNYNLDNL